MAELTDAKKHDLMRMQIMKQMLKSVETTEALHSLIDMRGQKSGRKKKPVEATPEAKVAEQVEPQSETIEFPKPKSELERLADRLETLERKIAVNEFKQRKEVA